MTHQKKWKRIREIGERLKALAEETHKLHQEETDLLMTRTVKPLETPDGEYRDTNHPNAI